MLQLNWLHDPTFAGEYRLAKGPGPTVRIKEGGPNISAVAEVASGRSNVAVVGADIFLQALDADYRNKQGSDLVCVFVDLQRNPVGWVLHPDAAGSLGYTRGLDDEPAKRNQWFFQQVSKGVLKVGDKRGTETTAVWIQWKKRYPVPAEITVVPVGFDTAVVLSAPKLAYPVYLNEEPYKLTERIGRPVVVFDPAADGVRSYGNVLISTRGFVDRNAAIVKEFQQQLRRSWDLVRRDIPAAVAEVREVYKGVSDSVIRSQIEKTIEFVYYGSVPAGSMDVEPGGTWERTLRSLQDAGIVSDQLSLALIRRHLLPPE